MGATVASPRRHAGKYLTALIAWETYGIAVLKVRAIIRLQRITPVPRMPELLTVAGLLAAFHISRFG